MEIRNILSACILLMAPTVMGAGVPQSIIHPEWEYTYYNDFFNNYTPYLPVYQKCGFTEEREIDGHTYWLFTLLTQTEKDGITKDRNVPLAYMREENGEVFMRLHSETPSTTGFYLDIYDTYGFKDRDLMIYNFNLNQGDKYQIGEPDSYPVYNPDPDADPIDSSVGHWLWEQQRIGNYAYLPIWDNGRLSVADIMEDESLGRRVWFMHQKCTYPEDLFWPWPKRALLDELDEDFDTTHIRTFRFVEGIGCLKSFLPFPGLYPPSIKINTSSIGLGGTPYLCEITDKTTGETIYKDERRPDQDNSVDEIGAEGENVGAEYYTLQGIRVLNPEPGEICIVRRGAKVTKEVIAR